MTVATKTRSGVSPKQVESRAKKLYAAFVAALRLKRTWDSLSNTEQAAWRSVAQVQ